VETVGPLHPISSRTSLPIVFVPLWSGLGVLEDNRNPTIGTNIGRVSGAERSEEERSRKPEILEWLLLCLAGYVPLNRPNIKPFNTKNFFQVYEFLSVRYAERSACNP